jgi:hypothetical protein
MYNNFEHEIDCPNDIYIKNFLWSDYFHDSEIESIKFFDRFGSSSKRSYEILLTLDSCRDKKRKLEKMPTAIMFFAS